MADLEHGSPEWWLRTLQNRQMARRRSLLTRDAYYRGEHRMLFASPKFRKIWGGTFDGFSDNWCGTVIDAVVERQVVEGFRFGENEQADGDIWEMWQANTLDADSKLAHVDSAVFGEAYALVWPDDEVVGGVRITAESPTQMIVARDHANRRRVRAALKWYLDDDDHQVAYVYLPDGVFRFRSRTRKRDFTGWSTNAWVPEDREGTEDPAEQSSPIPGVVPVAIIPNRSRLDGSTRSEIHDVMPLQDLCNKFVVDLAAASEQSAKSQRYVENWEPEIDEATKQAKAPPWDATDLVWFAPPPDADGQAVRFGQFTPSDLRGHINAIELMVNHIAAISRTPPHYLSPSADRLSGESIKSSESGLVSKVRDRNVEKGEGWEWAIRLALRIRDDDRAGFVAAETVWQDPEIRSEAELADAAIKRQQLGVPNRQLQEDVGYSPTQVDRFDSMRAKDSLLAELDDAEVARSAAETIQKVYLGVTAGVLTIEEARRLANRAGAQLEGAAP